MKKAEINPARLCGTLTAQPSKSVLHRAIVCAALAAGKSTIFPFVPSDDIRATIGAVKALGASVTEQDGTLVVDGTKTFLLTDRVINCAESGTTLRLLLPVAAAGALIVSFTGAGRLPQRPLGPYLDCLPPAGVHIDSAGGLPLTLSGALHPGEFRVPGNVSSQFISGLLLALPLLGGDSEILLTTPLESAAYVDLTIDVLRGFGVQVQRREAEDGVRFSVPGRQHYAPRDFTVEGDWSQAAFWLCANAIGSDVRCRGLLAETRQGDRAILKILQQFGAVVDIAPDGEAFVRHGSLRAAEVDASQVPDLVPVLAVVAAFSAGCSVIRGASRLRLKESDRLRALAEELRALGANIREEGDSLVFHGRPTLRGGVADGAHDHRIVMALAVAATRCKGPSLITGCESISKSYPGFFLDYNSLGGDARVVDMG